MACAVLHNIAMERGEPEPEPLFEEGQQEIVEGGNGYTIRDYIARTFFA